MKRIAKRMLVLALVLMMLAATGNVESYAAGSKAQSKKAIKAYSKVLTGYSNLAKKLSKKQDAGTIPKDISSLWVDQFRLLTLNGMKNMKAVYRIEDINNDGIPEMFVGMKYTDSLGASKSILNVVYTYKKKAIMLAEGTGDRACVELHENGVIATFHYGGAGFYGYTYYKLPKKSAKLKKKVQVEADWGKFTKTVNNRKSQSITQDEYNAVVTQYSKTKISPKWGILSKNAIKATKKGFATYKEYKKKK